MAFVLGLDGGGTKTRAVVLDEKGNVAGFGINGGSDFDAVGFGQAKENLQRAIVQACDALPNLSELDAIHVGIAGVVSRKDIQVVHNMLEGLDLSSKTFVKVTHDCSTALAGAAAGKPGMILISGTGSSCFGRDADGKEALSGGWGYLFGDVGSGYYLGHQALAAVLSAFDGRGQETLLTEPILEALGVDDIMEVMHRIYHPRLDISGIAALAPLVTEFAERDEVARSIILNGCKGLVEVVDSVVNKLQFQEGFPIVPVGGLAVSDSIFSKKLYQMLKEAFPEAVVSKPLTSPLTGAGMLALQEIGVRLHEETMIKVEKEIQRIP